MDEKNLTVLTQEKFDYAVTHSISRVVRFENKIVDIKNIYNRMYYVFIRCKIIGIKDEAKELAFPSEFTFYSCEIVDYKNISTITCQFAYFENCSFIEPVPLACPEKGEFIGWKKCFWASVDKFGNEIFPDQLKERCLVKLLIPANAKRSSAFTNKCRCNKAKVLEVYDSITDKKLTGKFVVYSSRLDERYGKHLYYEKGKWVYPDSFDNNRYNECSNGIHFFMDKESARLWRL